MPSSKRTAAADPATIKAAMQARAAGASTDTSFVTSQTKTEDDDQDTTTFAGRKVPLKKSDYAIKPTVWQSAIYMFLVALSVCSLLYLVYVANMGINISPAAQINGTWHVAADTNFRGGSVALQRDGAALAGMAGSESSDVLAEAIRESGDDDAAADERTPEQNKKNKKITNSALELGGGIVVQVDLTEHVDFYDSREILTVPEAALPLDVAPGFVEPLMLDTFKKGFNGGARLLHWSGSCQAFVGVGKDKQQQKKESAMCVFSLSRGTWNLAVFPSDAAAFTVVGTRLEGGTLAEEAAFNQKVKYVLIIMVVVAVVHYALSAFKPPSVAQVKRDALLARLEELKRQEEARKLAAAEGKKND